MKKLSHVLQKMTVRETIFNFPYFILHTIVNGTCQFLMIFVNVYLIENIRLFSSFTTNLIFINENLISKIMFKHPTLFNFKLHVLSTGLKKKKHLKDSDPNNVHSGIPLG